MYDRNLSGNFNVIEGMGVPAAQPPVEPESASVRLVDGSTVKIFFGCENPDLGYDDMSEDEIVKAIRQCRMFIRTGWDSEPERVIMKPIGELDMESFQSVDKGAPGLAVCDDSGKALFSLVMWGEEHGCTPDECGIYVFSLRDMLFR